MALEDRALAIIRGNAVMYDGLRAQLGVSPAELDVAIANLERSKTIRRERGRFVLVDGSAPPKASALASDEPPPTAEEEAAAAMKRKTCNECDAEKPLDEFPKSDVCKDGHMGQCKACIAKKARARRIAKLAGDTAQSARKQVAPVPKVTRTEPAMPAPKRATGALLILHIPDGVRVGPISISASGLAQMPYHIDLTLEQLDQLVAWHTSARKGAAA